MTPGSVSAGAVSAGAVSAGSRRLPFAALILALVLGGLCALLALNTAAAADELTRHQLAVKNEDLNGQVQQLTAQVAQSQAPDSLAKAAAALGMVPAGNPAFLVVGADGKVSVRGTAAAAVAPATPTPTPGPPPDTVALDGNAR